MRSCACTCKHFTWPSKKEEEQLQPIGRMHLGNLQASKGLTVVTCALRRLDFPSPKLGPSGATQPKTLYQSTMSFARNLPGS
eukprot:1134251-Pelagomonas_calceolata.AAC.1